MARPALSPIAPGDRPSLHAWLGAWIAADPDPGPPSIRCPGRWPICLERGTGGPTRTWCSSISTISGSDRGGEMRRLADHLGIEVDEKAWPLLVEAASFENMRAGSPRTATPAGVLKDPAAFFRRGTSGEGAQVLDRAERELYHRRARGLAPEDLLRWLHRDQPGPVAAPA